MNENASSNPSTTSASHHGLTAEAISRRAYELWEKEGRPENRDLHHWLRAEKELLAEQAPQSTGAAATSRPQNTDTQPLQGTRAGAAAARDPKAAPKKSSTPPFPGDRNATARPPTSGMRTTPGRT